MRRLRRVRRGKCRVGGPGRRVSGVGRRSSGGVWRGPCAVAGRWLQRVSGSLRTGGWGDSVSLPVAQGVGASPRGRGNAVGWTLGLLSSGGSPPGRGLPGSGCSPDSSANRSQRDATGTLRIATRPVAAAGQDHPAGWAGQGPAADRKRRPPARAGTAPAWAESSIRAAISSRAVRFSSGWPKRAPLSGPASTAV